MFLLVFGTGKHHQWGSKLGTRIKSDPLNWEGKDLEKMGASLSMWPCHIRWSSLSQGDDHPIWLMLQSWTSKHVPDLWKTLWTIYDPQSTRPKETLKQEIWCNRALGNIALPESPYRSWGCILDTPLNLSTSPPCSKTNSSLSQKVFLTMAWASLVTPSYQISKRECNHLFKRHVKIQPNKYADPHLILNCTNFDVYSTQIFPLLVLCCEIYYFPCDFA